MVNELLLLFNVKECKIITGCQGRGKRKACVVQRYSLIIILLLLSILPHPGSHTLLGGGTWYVAWEWLGCWAWNPPWSHNLLMTQLRSIDDLHLKNVLRDMRQFKCQLYHLAVWPLQVSHLLCASFSSSIMTGSTNVIRWCITEHIHVPRTNPCLRPLCLCLHQ